MKRTHQVSLRELIDTRKLESLCIKSPTYCLARVSIGHFHDCCGLCGMQTHSEAECFHAPKGKADGNVGGLLVDIKTA